MEPSLLLFLEDLMLHHECYHLGLLDCRSLSPTPYLSSPAGISPYCTSIPSLYWGILELKRLVEVHLGDLKDIFDKYIYLLTFCTF